MARSYKKGKYAKRRQAYRDEVRRYTFLSLPGCPGENTRDHIVPVSYGFKHQIPPELIGSRENLRCIPKNENEQKGRRMTAEGVALLRKWGYHDLADMEEARITTIGLLYRRT